MLLDFEMSLFASIATRLGWGEEGAESLQKAEDIIKQVEENDPFQKQQLTEEHNKIVEEKKKIDEKTAAQDTEKVCSCLFIFSMIKFSRWKKWSLILTQQRSLITLLLN